MSTFQDLLDSKKPSETFFVQPQQLGMTLREFSRLASDWVAVGGGPGFRLISTHHESETGDSLYDLVKLEKL